MKGIVIMRICKMLLLSDYLEWHVTNEVVERLRKSPTGLPDGCRFVTCDEYPVVYDESQGSSYTRVSVAQRQKNEIYR